MALLDYIFIGALLLGFVIGFWKGLLKQIFALVGIFVIALATVALSPTVSGWLSFFGDEGISSLVAMIVTFVIFAVVYFFVTRLVSKIINRTPVLGKLNRILGAVFSVAVVYMIFAVIVALLLGTTDEFLPSTKNLLANSLEDSWVVNSLYGGKENPSRNFFGNWLLNILQNQLSSIIPAGTTPAQ